MYSMWKIIKIPLKNLVTAGKMKNSCQEVGQENRKDSKIINSVA